METIGHILASVTFIWLWDTMIRDSLFMKDEGITKVYRIKLFRYLDRKPLSCSTCLSFWVGLALFYFTNDIFLLPLPLYYKLIIKAL